MPVTDTLMPSFLEHSEIILSGIVDFSWNLIKVNNSLARHFGLEAPILSNRSFAQLIHPDDWPKLLEAKRQCLVNPYRPVSVTVRSCLPDGKEYSSIWEISGLMGVSGNERLLVAGTIHAEENKIRQRGFRAEWQAGKYAVDSGIHHILRDADKHPDIGSGALMDLIPMGILVCDDRAAVLEFNSAAPAILGLPSQQLRGMKLGDIFEQSVDENGLPCSGWERLVSGDAVDQRELILGIPRNTGLYTWIKLGARPFRNPADQYFAVLSFADITEYRLSESAVRNNEARWKFALDGSGEGVWEYDLKSGEIFFSDQYKRVLGFEPEEWDNNVEAWRSRIHPDDRPMIDSIDRKYASGDIRNHTIEYRMMHKDGQYIWVSDRGMLIDSPGNSSRLVGTHADITQRKQAELALAQSANHFKSLSRNLPGAVYEYIFHPDGSSEFSYISDSVEKLFGIKPAEFAASYDFIHPEDLPLLLEKNRISRDTNAPFHFEGRIVTPDGRIKWHTASSFFSHQLEDGSRVFTGIIVDNTERKQAERLLRESAMRFRAIFNSMFQFIGLMETDGTLIEANQTAFEFGGVTEEEVINRPIWDTYWWKVNEKTRAELKAAVRRAAKGEFVRYEVEIYDRHHQLTLIDFSIKPVSNDHGEIILLIPEGRDISEQRRAEKELLKSTEKLSSFLENAPTMNWIIDSNGKLLYMNDRYMKAHDLKESDKDISIYDLFPPNLARVFMENNRYVVESNTPLQTIEEGIRPDGTRTVLQVYKFPIPGEAGEKLLGGYALDITELTVNNEALEKSNERFHYVSKATSDAIWDWDVRENRLFRGTGFRYLFGDEETETNIENKMERIHPQDADRVSDSLETAMFGSLNRWQAEYRFRCADGSYKTVIDKGYIIRGEDGMAIRLIGAMQDITGQRSLEKQLHEEQERQKRAIMEAVIKAQEREREEISYELHDNVNQILSSGKLFLEIATRNNDENPLLYINKGKESIQLAIDEIRKISHGLNSSSIGLVGLSGALKDLADQINLSGRMKIYFSYTEPYESQPVDRDIDLALFRIAQEQLNNIIKHAQATEVRIILAYPGQRISLLIADNGIGFDPDTTRKGLGLNNILNRSEHYRGNSELITSPGNGCILKVSFPRQVLSE